MSEIDDAFSEAPAPETQTPASPPHNRVSRRRVSLPLAQPAVPATRDEVGRGLEFINNALGGALLDAARTSAHLYALTELLIARGVISLHELERRKAATTEALIKQTIESWPAARLHPDDVDKYQVEPAEIDCLERLHLCKAACCRFGFHLTRQDVAEGVAQWDFARPYHVKQRPDGYCLHCDEGTLSCTVREHRPFVCRAYDCRDDARVWVDFEARIPNPNLSTIEAPRPR